MKRGFLLQMQKKTVKENPKPDADRASEAPKEKVNDGGVPGFKMEELGPGINRLVFDEARDIKINSCGDYLEIRTRPSESS